MISNFKTLTFAMLVAVSFVNESSFAMGRARATTPTTPVSTPTPVPPGATPAPPVSVMDGTPSCVSSDANQICIGLKMVAYTKNGVPVLSQAEAIPLLAGINKVWSQCNIAFQLEKYEAVDPADRGFTYDTNWSANGDRVRTAYNDGSSFLVVSVGTLSGSTIGVTEMPGAGVYGTLIEDSYAKNFLTVGHELGHYMGLYHIKNTSNLMSAYIGPNTEALSTSQCDIARSTNYSYWQSMMRH